MQYIINFIGTCYRYYPPIKNAVSVGRYPFSRHPEQNDKQSLQLQDIFQRELSPFVTKLHIRKDIQIVAKVIIGLCEAQGMNWGSGRPTIFIHPKFAETDLPSFRWVARHELSHILNDDLFRNRLLGGIILIAMRVLFRKYQSLTGIAMNMLSNASAMFASAAYQRYRETSADALATAESSTEDLQGGIRFFRARQTALLHERQLFPQIANLVSPEGENKRDIIHPTLSSRVAAIRRELARRGASYTDADVRNDPRFPKLVNIFLDSEGIEQPYVQTQMLEAGPA